MPAEARFPMAFGEVKPTKPYTTTCKKCNREMAVGGL
jgi:hypothetical protein